MGSRDSSGSHMYMSSAVGAACLSFATWKSLSLCSTSVLLPLLFISSRSLFLHDGQKYSSSWARDALPDGGSKSDGRDCIHRRVFACPGLLFRVLRSVRLYMTFACRVNALCKSSSRPAIADKLWCRKKTNNVTGVRRDVHVTWMREEGDRGLGLRVPYDRRRQTCFSPISVRHPGSRGCRSSRTFGLGSRVGSSCSFCG